MQSPSSASLVEDDGSTRASALARAQPPAVPPHLQSTAVLEQLVKPTLLPARKDRRLRRITNWGGTFTDAPEAVFSPASVAECCNIVELARRSGKALRAVGRAHSPSDLMMTDGWAVRTEGMAGVLAIEAGKPESGGSPPTATLLGGTLVSDISTALARHNPPCALSSLGSISEQTIGGLISTATHGSGHGFPAVSALVLELDIIVALPPERGGVQVVRCSRNHHPDLFNATLCGLGATGIIAAVKLPIEPAFRLKHLVEEVEFDWLFGPATGFPASQSSNDEKSGATAASTSAQSARPASIGQLVAADLPLPPLRQRYSPSVRQASPADIWPCPATEDARLSRPLASDPDPEDDEETRLAQERIDAVVRSSQHTRLWWFPHVGMATLSRADRTYEPAVKPTLGQRAYHSIVGFHLTQLLLFVSRYHSALPPRVARVVHYLTHPAFPTSDKAHGAAAVAAAPTSEAATVPPTTPASTPPPTAPTFTTEFEAFGATPATLASPTSGPSSASSLQPLQPHHPSSMTVDHSHNVFNMDCLFPQYTTEWAIPASHTAACLRALRDWLAAESARSPGAARLNHHFPIEVRWTAPDGIWLSHGYARSSCYIGLIQFRPYSTPVPYRRLFAKFERLMRHFAGRPHWAKTHTCGVQELAGMYPHLGDWLQTRREWDPQGVMLGPYVRRHLLGEVGEDVGVRRFKRRERGVL